MIPHPYPPGTRVRHSGERYPEAREHGTAVVLSSLAQGTRHRYEYLVQRDVPLVPGNGETVGWWASSATVAV